MSAETAISSAVTRASKSSVNSFMAKALPDGDVDLHRNGKVSFAASQQMSQAAKGCGMNVFHGKNFCLNKPLNTTQQFGEQL